MFPKAPLCRANRHFLNLLANDDYGIQNRLSGENSASMSTRIIWSDGAVAFIRTPKKSFCLISSGAVGLKSSIVGNATPYPSFLAVSIASEYNYKISSPSLHL